MRLFLIVLGLWLFSIPSQALVRIKDITAPQGLRDNQLVGYGLVVGLQSSGDTLRNSVFTEQALQSMLDRMGVNVRGTVLRTRNVAAVIVTADLPPSIGRGSRVDITVSSLGDATSLMGGTLVMTPLNGPDGQTYAVAQGALIVSGMSAVGQAETVTQGVPTAGRIPNGATIERELPGQSDLSPLSLVLKNPDYATVVRIADAINEYSLRRFGKRTAREKDFRTVSLSRPPRVGTARFLAEIGDLVVEPDTVARIVVDARSGTIVIGQDVQISTVAVTHGNLSVRITETPVVSQPAPLSRGGQTVVTPQTAIDVSEAGGQIAIVGGATLRSLVRGLNQIGVKPTGVIAILQAIKSSGALQADLVVQ